MLRRILFLTISLILIAEPAYSQTWLQRYLRERKAKEDAKNTTGDSSEEVRKAEPVNAAATPENSAPAVDESPAPAVPNETPIPIRRAELADPPAASATPLPIRRAEPVDVSFDTVPIRKAEPVEPEPTPIPIPAKPVATPVVIVSTPPPAVPVATPVVKIVKTQSQPPSVPPVQPVVTPVPPSVAPIIVTGTSTPPADEMDPNTNVIRIAPTNKPVPPDISQFNYANSLYAKKEYAMAATEYERYLNLYRVSDDRQAALFRLAESHRQLQNFNAARKAYESLLLDFADGDFVGPAAYRLADICFQEKNYPDALAYYRKAAVRVKDPAILLSAKYCIARCLESLKSPTEAIDAYQEVLLTAENNPFREASRFALARLLVDCGRKTEAITQLDALSKETDKPNLKAEATVRQGLLLLDMGKNEKAIESLTRALKMPEIGSWKEVAEVSMLRVLYNSQNYQQILDAYRDSDKQFSPEAQPEVLLIVANSDRQLGQDKAARALYEQIARDYPATSYAKDSQYYRIVTLYNVNAPELMAEVDTYLAQNPEANDKRDQIILLKAEALYKAKKYAEAAPLYATLDDSRLIPSLKAEALFKLGWCYTQTQPRDNPAAIQAFSAFLNQYPANKLAATALAQRALSYQQCKNLKAALADFNSLLSRYPKAAKEQELALEQKALILGQQDDKQGMAETFSLLLQKFPDSSVAGKANYWIGWAACEARNYKTAIAPLQAARNLDKEHFGDKATRLLLQTHRTQENRAALAAEIDKADETKTKVPTEFLRWLGTEYFQAGDAAHAVKYLAKLTTQANPAEVQPEDWLILGSAHTKQSQWDEAAKTLKTYLSKVSEPSQQATGYLALGEAQLGAKQFVDAQKAADDALSLQPEGRLNAQGRMLSGDIAMARGDFVPAAKLYYSVSVVFGDDPEITPKALAQACIAYKKAADNAQVAKTLNELQSRYPEYPVPSVK